MPSYEEIMATPADLSSMERLADDLDAIARIYGDLAHVYRTGVEEVTESENWSGESSAAAIVRFHGTRAELWAARTEARAVAQLIREGKAEIKRLRNELQSRIEEASERGFVVNATGTVSYDPEVRDAAEAAQNPDIAAITAEVQAQIDDVVRTITEYDYLLGTALGEVADRGGTRGINLPRIFNDRAEGDLGAMAGVRAGELAERLLRGSNSDAELEEFTELMESNADDSEFSRAVLEILGAEGLFTLAALSLEKVLLVITMRGSRDSSEILSHLPLGMMTPGLEN